MIEFVLLALLALFIGWGVKADPGRPFSWSMYSGSAKGFLWTELSGTPRVLSYEELSLSPESHYLPLPQLRQLLAQRPPPVPLRGLLIGSQGNWLVAYNKDDPQVRMEASLPVGAELDHLAALLRRFPDQ
jgi:hypothetical protein